MHGIKGASQQIGRQALSESAEIMEMAAKTENIRYLEKHMTEFLETIRHTLESVEDELKNLPQEIQGKAQPRQRTYRRKSSRFWRSLGKLLMRVI